jgi:uncharacterized protein with ParB-like and HNH nuclease domain
MAKYSVTQQSVESLLALVHSGQVAIPELQRPFVWNTTKVRDLLDSLYKGYPVGYLITWQSVGAALKDGQTAAHQQILIDGQQRITALRAAVAGLSVVDKRYKKQRITIGFNPVTEEFETTTPVIRKNPQWIPDISELLSSASSFSFIGAYFGQNPDVDSLPSRPGGRRHRRPLGRCGPSWPDRRASTPGTSGSGKGRSRAARGRSPR